VTGRARNPVNRKSQEIDGNLDGKDRPDPFPTCEQAVSHGLVERTRIGGLVRDELGETLVDPATPNGASIPLIVLSRANSSLPSESNPSMLTLMI